LKEGRTERTAARYAMSWLTLERFLEEHEISRPRDLTYPKALAFMEWRAAYRAGRFNASHNTAVWEVKLLGNIMSEAVRRGFAENSPIRDLKLRRRRFEKKPSFGEEQLAIIEKAILAMPESKDKDFFLHSFLIGRYQGRRLSETRLNPLKDVDLARQQITFHVKGDLYQTTLLHPQLVPLFAKLIANGTAETFPAPKSLHTASNKWRHFLERIGLKDWDAKSCFHSFRVTAATNLARAGVPQSVAMRFMGHATTAVHDAYIRLQTNDLHVAARALGPAPTSADKPSTPENPDDPAARPPAPKQNGAGT
jgi:integrase